MTLYKRITPRRRGAIAKAFYPVFPPDKTPKRSSRGFESRMRLVTSTTQGRLIGDDDVAPVGRQVDARCSSATGAPVIADIARRRAPTCRSSRRSSSHGRQPREHEEESKNVDWSHEIAPDRLLPERGCDQRPDEPVVHPNT
jgi:hypothetical protein